MDQRREFVDQLATLDHWSYLPEAPSSAETAAWSVLALTRCGRPEAARRPARWLANLQQANGAVGVTANQQQPRWPTSLAIRAWHAFDSDPSSTPEFQASVSNGIGSLRNVEDVNKPVSMCGSAREHQSPGGLWRPSRDHRTPR